MGPVPIGKLRVQSHDVLVLLLDDAFFLLQLLMESPNIFVLLLDDAFFFLDLDGLMKDAHLQLVPSRVPLRT